MHTVEQLLAQLGAEPLSSATLQQRLGASQPTLSRLLRRAAGRVLRIGRGRATRYAATAEVFGAGWVQPLFEVDERGRLTQVANLRALASGGYWIEALEDSFWLRGESQQGLFASLPYFLHDLRPAGFLGRLTARRVSRQWGVPPDPRDWSDAQIGTYLLQQGEDLPGNLVLGESAAQAVQQARAPSVVVDRAESYPRLAAQVLADELPGSSAAGEQPKFAIYERETGHVIVKFSPRGRAPDARRWRDLLRAEAHALALLAERGYHAAETRLHAFAGRVFLESVRFDRVGAKGRRPLISLSMVDAEYVGVGHGWGRVAEGLEASGLLARESCDALRWLELFGHWIGNSDMHLGNISLAPGEGSFELLPIYDMLPMRWAPLRGELPQVELPAPIRKAGEREAWADAGRAACDFWARLAGDGQLESDVRTLAAEASRRGEAALGDTREGRR